MDCEAIGPTHFESSRVELNGPLVVSSGPQKGPCYFFDKKF